MLPSTSEASAPNLTVPIAKGGESTLGDQNADKICKPSISTNSSVADLLLDTVRVRENSWASSSSGLQTSNSVSGSTTNKPFHTKSCPICLERFDPENPSKVLTCRHSFHVQCIESWRQRSQQCPMCQSLFMGSDVLGDEPKVASGAGSTVVADLEHHRISEDEALARRLAREEEAAALLDRRARSHSHLSVNQPFVARSQSAGTRRSRRRLHDGESDTDDRANGGSSVESDSEDEEGMRSFTIAPRRLVRKHNKTLTASQCHESGDDQGGFEAHNEAVSLVREREREVPPTHASRHGPSRRAKMQTTSSRLQVATPQITFFKKLRWLASCCRRGSFAESEDYDDVEALGVDSREV